MNIIDAIYLTIHNPSRIFPESELNNFQQLLMEIYSESQIEKICQKPLPFQEWMTSKELLDVVTHHIFTSLLDTITEEQLSKLEFHISLFYNYINDSNTFNYN